MKVESTASKTVKKNPKVIAKNKLILGPRSWQCISAGFVTLVPVVICSFHELNQFLKPSLGKKKPGAGSCWLAGTLL